MNPRATLALFLAAGCPAAAQEHFFVHYSWVEVNAGTTAPASGPLAGNSTVDPGEGARIRIGITAMINGTNAVGQTITYTNPAPGGVGTVRGIGSVWYDLIGDGNAIPAQGTWSPFPQGPSRPPFGGEATNPMIQNGGASVHGIGGSQFIAPGGTASPINNDVQIFRGVWNPAVYSHRTVNWRGRGSIVLPAGWQNTVLFAYGTGTGTDPTSGQVFTFDLLNSKRIGTDFGQGINIPIAPAPSTLWLLGLLPFARRPERPV